MRSCQKLSWARFHSVFSLTTWMRKWTTVIEFANETELGGVTSTPENRIRIQNDLDKLEKWSKVSKMKFSGDKDTLVHLGKRDQMHAYKMGNN